MHAVTEAFPFVIALPVSVITSRSIMNVGSITMPLIGESLKSLS